MSFRPGGVSAWRWPVRFFTGRRSFFWTSPPPASTPSRGGISGSSSGKLAAEGVTIFVTTHYMDEALNCDRIVMINEGRIVAIGSPGEIIAEVCPGEAKATLNDAFI